MSKPLLTRVIVALLYISPLTLFLYNKNFLFPLATLKIHGFFILVDLLAIVWAFLVLLDTSFIPKFNSPITKGLVIFLSSITVAGIFGIDPLRSFFSTPERTVGILALWHFFVYYLAITTFIKTEQGLSKYIKYLFGVSVAVACTALLQTVFPRAFLGGQTDRHGGVLDNPIFLAGYILSYLFLGFSYFLKKQSKTPILELSGFALLVCGFVVANTRGAIVGLVAGIISSILIFLIFRSKKATESSARLVALTAIIAVLIGLALSLMVANQKSDTKIPFLGRFSASNLNDASIANRLTAWSNAWQGFKQNPILGVGPENFRKISDLYFDPLIIKGGASENYFDKPHSVLLEILSTSGLLGFLAFLYLLYLAFKNSLLFLSSPAEKAIAFGAIIAYLGQGFFSFDSFATYLTFFAGLAVLALMRADSAKPNKQ